MGKVKRLKVLGLAKFQAILGAYFGFLVAMLYSFGGLIYDLLTVGLNLGTALAFFALIGMPVVFAGLGFGLGLVEAILFNLFSRWFGGIDVDLGA